MNRPDAAPVPKDRAVLPEGHRRQVWIALSDHVLATELQTELHERGCMVALVTSSCRELTARLAEAPTPPVPPLLICGVRLFDGDAFTIIRMLASRADAPMLAVVSRQQRSVIRAACSLAEAYGVRVVRTCELPAAPQAIAASLLQAVAESVRPRARRRASAPPLTLSTLTGLVDRGAMQPYFQPKMRLDSHEIVGFEALMRAHDEQGGVITPDRLIDPLVQHGLLATATLQIAHRTIDFVAACLSDGLGISASINVTLSLISDAGFCSRLVAMVEAAGLEPSSITLEITESEAVTDLATVIEQTGRIRMMGFNLSIDDFGTAYSSFFQLSKIPFSELKVERAFIKDVTDSFNVRAIVGACSHLGRSLGLGVIAEGVETLEQLETLTLDGYTAAQGFLIARPMPAPTAHKWLRAMEAKRLAPVVGESQFVFQDTL